MKNNRSIKRRGFTLVELLIVIVVIGVLSAMMMLSSTEAVSSARASNIVSNLRNLKTAALAWYADHLDDVTNLTDTNNLNSKRSEILKYMNNNDDTGDLAKYLFVGNATDGTWFVYYNGGSEITLTISQKLAGRASTVGLLASNSQTKSGSTDANTYIAAASANPYMFIR